MSNNVSFHNVHIENLYISSGGATISSIPKRIFFNRPIYPGDGNDHPVRPRLNLTGTICASVYRNSETLVGAKALVYESGLISGPLNVPAAAVSGTKTAGPPGSTWTWGSVPGAVHAASSYPSNKLVIWVAEPTTDGSPPVYEYSGFSYFNGMTGTDTPCGGSGTGSGGHGMLPGELQTGTTLLITIADGPNRGTYKAESVGYMQWKADIHSAIHTLSLGGCGEKLIVQTPQGKVTSSKFDGQAFFVTLDGAAFGSQLDTFVTLA